MKSRVTGERLEVSDLSENSGEHLHRYALAQTLCSKKIVLDIACGEGYGSNLLAKNAAEVIGVDIDPETVSLAANKYISSNLKYMVGDVTMIPFEDDYFDVVVSFETLEHHDKHKEMMKEIKRVLKPSGVCIISTPDKLVYSDKKNYNNPFHVKELYKDEFNLLISAFFSTVIMLKQRFVSGSFIIPENPLAENATIFTGNFMHIEKSKDIEAEYLIAIASDKGIELPNTSFFVDYEFSKKKILDFQQQSIRYKVGKIILTPGRIIKKMLGIKNR